MTNRASVISGDRHAACRSYIAFVVALIAATSLLIGAAVQASQQVFRVQGSGSGDNTAAIQAAFDAATEAGPGSVVEFAGLLFSNEISIDGFHGVVRGDPDDPPVIDVLRALDPGLPGIGLRPVGSVGAFSNPWFEFRDSSVHMRGPLTFAVSAEHPAELHNLPFEGLTEVGNVIRFTGTSSATVKGITIRGNDAPAPRPFGTKNVRVGIAVFGGPTGPTVAPVFGDYRISDSTFGDVIIGISANGLTAGDLVTAQSRFQHSEIGILIANSKDSRIRILHNDMAEPAFAGVLVDQVQEPGATMPKPVSGTTRVLVKDNTVDAARAFGLLFADNRGASPPVNTLRLRIRRNSIHGAGVSPLSMAGVEDARVLGNAITGNWFVGVEAIEGSNNCQLLGNRFGRARHGGTSGIETVAGAVSILGSDNCDVIVNRFTDVTGKAVVVGPGSRFNRIRFNDYRRSGIDECAIVLQGDNNAVLEFAFPPGTGSDTQVCDSGSNNLVW